MSEINFNVIPTSGVIKTNFEDVKRQLAEEVGQYENVVFTEETKTDAKKTVADLRKLRKSIDDSRKEVKKQWMVPYERFEAEVKGLLGMVDKPINSINGQVEAFEQERIKVRKAEIEGIYAEEIGELKDFLPLYKISNEKWLNAGTSVKAIRKAMAESIADVRAGKTAIEAMQSDAVPAALRKFQATLNLADCIAYINQCEAQKAEILRREEEFRRQEEERRHQAEIERVRTEERQRMAVEERIRKEAEQKTVEAVKSVNAEMAAELALPESYTAVYTVVGTDEELRELEMAMLSLGLYYERKDI